MTISILGIELYFGKKKASGINNNACTQSTKRELGQKFNDRGNETVKVKEMNFFSTLHIFRICLGKKGSWGELHNFGNKGEIYELDEEKLLCL